jgi:Bax protein
VLLVNEDILADRKQLWSIRHNLNIGERLLPEQRIWLEVLSERYATLADGLDELARRVDVIPPSIVLAAASKMLQSGASVTAHGAKSAVAERATAIKQGVGETPHRLDSPLDTVRAYMRTLNTAPAYDGFRRERERLRLAGEPLDGQHLAASLPKLRPSNQLSAEELSAVITAHRLTRFDRARLQRSGPAS